MMQLNWVDIAFLAWFLISVLIGLFRGFVREFFSLLSWVVAAVIATMFAGKAAAWFSGTSTGQSIYSAGANASQSLSIASIAISFIVIFLIVFIIGKLITFMISSAVESGGIGFVNRVLGGLFGFIRGVVVAVVIIFLVQLSDYASADTWKQSQIVNTLQPLVQVMGNTIQPGLESLEQSVGQTFQNMRNQSNRNVSK